MLQEFIKMLREDSEGIVVTSSNEHHAVIEVEPNLSITIREHANIGMRCTVPLCPIMREKAEKVFPYLLEANLSVMETGGNILGIDPGNNQYVMTYFLFSGAGYREFYDMVETIANFAEGWREEIQLIEQ